MAADLKDLLQPERAEELLRTRGVRIAWKVVGAVFAVVLLVFGTLQIVTTLAHEEYTIVREFPASEVSMLDVQSSAGSVTIRGSDRNRDEITVTARISHGLRRTGHHEVIRDQRLALRSSCPVLGTQFCRVTYTVDVPTDIDVTVRSSDGHITVSDVTGDVDLDASGGGIDVARIGGRFLRIDSDAGGVDARALSSSDVDASSDAGGVQVAFVRPPQAVRAHSSAGGVEVVLPPGDEDYDVEAHSSAGGEEVLVNDVPSSPRKVDATSAAGGVTVRYGNG